MKRILSVIAALLVGLLAVYGQDIPDLKPLKNLDETLVPAQKKDKWGYANAKGKIIIKAVFDEAEEFLPVTSEDGTTMLVARIRVGDRWGYITRENVYLFEPEFDTISRFDNSASVVAKLGPNISLLGVRSAQSQKLQIPVLTGTVLQVNLSELREFSGNGLAWAARAGRWGILNTKGKWILPCEYDSWADVPGKELYAIGRDGKTGMCTKDGQVLIPATYDSILPLSSSFIVSVGGQSGVLGSDGSVVIEPQFRSVVWDDQLGFVVSNEGQFGRYDANGNVVYPCIFKAIPDTGLRGYEEMVKGGVPYICLAGANPIPVSEYDDTLYSKLNAEEYASSPVIPDWLKSHLGPNDKYVTLEDRMPAQNVELPEEFYGSYAECAEIHFKCGVSLADIVLTSEEDMIDPMLKIWDAGSKVYVLLHAVEDYWDFYEYDAKTRSTRNFGVKGDMVCDPEAGFIAETAVWDGSDAPIAHLTPMCFPASAKTMTMPILRYRFRTWAGEAFVFAGESVKGESGLKAVKAGSEIVAGQITYGESDQYCDFSMRIRSAAANGIALYELVATEHVYVEGGDELVAKSPRVVAYGYIGLGLPFFTQPVFYEARDFSEGKASVRVGDEWLSLEAAEISQMDPFIQPD